MLHSADMKDGDDETSSTFEPIAAATARLVNRLTNHQNQKHGEERDRANGKRDADNERGPADFDCHCDHQFTPR
jgi:hypothetical protein